MIQSIQVLDAFCPFHVLLSPTGHIVQAGRTIHKITQPVTILGKRFLEVFEITRPKSVLSVHDLCALDGRLLSLRLRQRPKSSFKGIAFTFEDGMVALNLSFGISVIEAVGDYSLSAGDFSPTDLTIEMLYLVEAKSLAMTESQHLNLRLRHAMIAAEEQAYTDTLTGLKNRRALDHVLQRNIASGKPFAVMHMDLDYFKRINDTHGHAAGDFVLQAAADAMLSETRETDLIARVGGDEFVILLAGRTSNDVADRLGTRLIRRIEAPICYKGTSMKISASIGFAMSSEVTPLTAETLADAADKALYAAKRAGRGRVCALSGVPPETLDP